MKATGPRTTSRPRAPDVVHQFEEGKIVADQPDQVWEKNQERAKGSDPDPGVRKKTPLRCQEERDENSHGEKGGAVFVFHPEPDENTKPKPVARFAVIDRANNAPGASEPDERLEGVHRQPMMEKKINGRGHDSESGQCLGESAATHFARHFSSQPNRRGAGQGGQQPQAHERFAEKMPRNPGDEGDQGWLIDVPGGEVLGAGEIIQFVAKDSVAAGGEEMKNELRESQQEHDGRTGEKAMGHGRSGARQMNCSFHLVVAAR